MGKDEESNVNKIMEEAVEKYMPKITHALSQYRTDGSAPQRGLPMPPEERKKEEEEERKNKIERETTVVEKYLGLKRLACREKFLTDGYDHRDEFANLLIYGIGTIEIMYVPVPFL